MESPTKMDASEVTPFQETSIYTWGDSVGYTHKFVYLYSTPKEDAKKFCSWVKLNQHSWGGPLCRGYVSSICGQSHI